MDVIHHSVCQIEIKKIFQGRISPHEQAKEHGIGIYSQEDRKS